MSDETPEQIFHKDRLWRLKQDIEDLEMELTAKRRELAYEEAKDNP